MDIGYDADKKKLANHVADVGPQDLAQEACWERDVWYMLVVSCSFSPSRTHTRHSQFLRTPSKKSHISHIISI